MSQPTDCDSAERKADAALMASVTSSTGRRPYVSPMSPPRSPPPTMPANTAAVRKPASAPDSSAPLEKVEDIRQQIVLDSHADSAPSVSS